MSSTTSANPSGAERLERAADITTLIGREVYSSNGIYVGEVEDVRLDLDAEQVTGLAMAGLNEELFAELTRGARGAIIPYRWVRAVGDIVIVHGLVERPRSHEDE